MIHQIVVGDQCVNIWGVATVVIAVLLVSRGDDLRLGRGVGQLLVIHGFRVLDVSE